MMLFLFFICVSSFLLCKVLCDQSAGRYDKNVNLFSSNGELMQVQYARNAGLKGASILCSNTIEGDVIMCVPTPADIQTLQDKRSVDKVAQISDGLWFAFSGLAGDGRALLKYARNFCIDYQTKFGSTPSIRSVARVLGEVQHESTLTGGKRPYGVQVILIGMDETGSRLSIYTSEPSGSFVHQFYSYFEYFLRCVDVQLLFALSAQVKLLIGRPCLLARIQVRLALQTFLQFNIFIQ